MTHLNAMISTVNQAIAELEKPSDSEPASKATEASLNKVETEKSVNLLSPNAQLILKNLVSWIGDKTIPSEFELFWGFGDEATIKNSKGEYIQIDGLPFRRLHFDSLVNARALFASTVSHDRFDILHRCYITPLGYDLAQGTPSKSPVEREYPVEITESLKRFEATIQMLNGIVS